MKTETKRRIRTIKRILQEYASFEPNGAYCIFRFENKFRTTCNGFVYIDMIPKHKYGKVKML